MYKKRSGTSGVRGQLYETKLLSLLLFRARHNNDIEEFHLATNVDEIGVFDDVCFRAKLKGFDRPVAMFIQAKHRDNDKVLTLNNKKDMAKYFDSYCKIRRAFKPNNEDVLFDGHFEETDCVFVLYTTAKDDHINKLAASRFISNLNDLIDTGGGAALQPSYNDKDEKILCKLSLKEQTATLAVQMSKFLYDDAGFQNMLDNVLVLQYHVILAEKVLCISDCQPEGYRRATFRESLFDTNDEFTILFKDTFFKEILKKRKVSDTDVLAILSNYFQQSPDSATLSKLIGSVITYNKYGKLEFFDKLTTEDLKQQLNKVYVSQITVDEAIYMAAREILTTRHFKVPTGFGNKDLTMRGSEVKVERRLSYLTSKIYDLLNESTLNNVVTIDESLGEGFLKQNGGIASAVGNIFVLDENTKQMKFTNNYELLGDLAKRLYEKLKTKILNLHEYRFEVKVKKFPKLSFECSEHDEIMTKDFLNKLLFYTNQADENGVEKILKNEIEDHQFNDGNNFRVKSDAIFLSYHDEIQKWWMLAENAPYLTKEIEAYDSTIRKIVQDPLMCVINIIYRNKVKNIDYTFKEDAVRSLNLQDQLSSTIIVAQRSALTVAKVIQHFKNNDHAVLDLEYIINLPMTDHKALCTELMNTSKNKLLIFVGDNVLNYRNRSKTLENIAKAVHDKTKIIITNQMSVEIIKKYFSQSLNLVNDERNSLSDLSDESRSSILENVSVIFQGAIVRLDLIVDDVSMAFVEGDVLDRIIRKETIVCGKSYGNSKYDEIKHLYIDRRVRRGGKPGIGNDYTSTGNSGKVIETLNDVKDDVVLITAKPGMGKSTLLTHISLKTKELNPKVWIVRINLLDYSREFSEWQEKKTLIGTLETLNFICQVILSEKHGKVNKLTIALEESNGVVNLKHCTGDELTVFELRMFLHFYNNKEIIFLFDGFDEICPHYSIEVLQFLKTVRNYPRKHKMWVTSRSYNKIKSMLHREFGQSYEIDYFSSNEQEKHLEKFLKSNLILNDLESSQLENVYTFIEFMTENVRKTGFRTIYKLQNLPLEDTYFNALNYLRNEIRCSYIPLWTYKNNFETVSRLRLHFYNGDSNDISNMYDFVGTPLHLYLIADYFQNEIKDVSEKSNKWNFEFNTFTVYERFLETKLKKIRFEEKNKMEIYNPDIKITYDKEYTDFIVKHRKLAAYAIFHRELHDLFSRKELKEIKNTIKFIKKGGEKTGLIYSIASNNIPVFVHRTFAEYFAVEHFCDSLKTEKCSERQKSIIDFILNGLVFKAPPNVLNILDSKIITDKALVTVLNKNEEFIFELLMGQAKCFSHIKDNNVTSLLLRRDVTFKYMFESSLDRVVSEYLLNFEFLFKSIFENYVNADNVQDFINLIRLTDLVTIAFYAKREEFVSFALDIVRKFDTSKILSLFDNITHYCSFKDYDEWSNQKIIEHIDTCMKTHLANTRNSGEGS